MAIFHFQANAIQRSKGKTATAAAAYRAGIQLHDIRTGKTFDYTKKNDVSNSFIVGWNSSRFDLWNAAEAAEKRKDGTTGREYVLALPVDLNNDLKTKLAKQFAEHVNNKYGVAVDVCIHAIDKHNPHAHVMTTTRISDGDKLLDKSELDISYSERKKRGLKSNPKHELESLKIYWTELVNAELKANGINNKIDHRSLKKQGINRAPTIKHYNNKNRVEINNQIKAANNEIQKLQAQATEEIRMIKPPPAPAATPAAQQALLQVNRKPCNSNPEHKPTHKPTAKEVVMNKPSEQQTQTNPGFDPEELAILYSEEEVNEYIRKKKAAGLLPGVILMREQNQPPRLATAVPAAPSDAQFNALSAAATFLQALATGDLVTAVITAAKAIFDIFRRIFFGAPPVQATAIEHQQAAQLIENHPNHTRRPAVTAAPASRQLPPLTREEADEILEKFIYVVNAAVRRGEMTDEQANELINEKNEMLEERVSHCNDEAKTLAPAAPAATAPTANAGAGGAGMSAMEKVMAASRSAAAGFNTTNLKKPAPASPQQEQDNGWKRDVPEL